MVEAAFSDGFPMAGLAAGATGDCPKTMVGEVCGLAGAGDLMFPLWNIIVRPAPSSAGAPGAGFAAAAGFAAGGGGGAGFAREGAANVIVAPSFGGGLGAGGLGGSVTASVATGLMTLKVFWHFPQRMVRPCGPMRASSTL
jgi:hypothetical protein